MTICRGAPCGYPHRCGVSTRHYPYRLLVGFKDDKFNNSVDIGFDIRSNLWLTARSDFRSDDVKIVMCIAGKLMTLTLDLPSELEQYLLREANAQGISIESMTLRLLINSIPTKQKQAEAVKLIQSWIDEDDEEQQETGQYLIQALDEDRLSDRKLFPLEMKGVTW
jgi:hypothetical protein